MVEWFKAAVLKTVVALRVTVGSNPTPSARQARCDTTADATGFVIAAPHFPLGLERRRPACQNRRDQWGSTLKTPKTLTEGQRSYEAKRAAKAGMSLDKWLASKQRQQEAEARAREKAAEPAKAAKKPGFLSRLLERAHKPL